MSVNSLAVLRLMGKGGGAVPAGVNRGRGTTRGGRGKLTYCFKCLDYLLELHDSG